MSGNKGFYLFSNKVKFHMIYTDHDFETAIEMTLTEFKFWYWMIKQTIIRGNFGQLGNFGHFGLARFKTFSKTTRRICINNVSLDKQ